MVGEPNAFDLLQVLQDAGFVAFAVPQEERHPLKPGQQIVHHGHRDVAVEDETLWNESEPGTARLFLERGEEDPAGALHLTEHGQGERGLARAVRPDDGGAFAERDAGADVVQDPVLAEHEPDVFEPDGVRGGLFHR